MVKKDEIVPLAHLLAARLGFPTKKCKDRRLADNHQKASISAVAELWSEVSLAPS